MKLHGKNHQGTTWYCLSSPFADETRQALPPNGSLCCGVRKSSAPSRRSGNRNIRNLSASMTWSYCKHLQALSKYVRQNQKNLIRSFLEVFHGFLIAELQVPWHWRSWEAGTMKPVPQAGLWRLWGLPSILPHPPRWSKTRPSVHDEEHPLWRYLS